MNFFIPKMLEICEKKIAAKGTQVGISFYVFFANKNDNPDLLMKVAKWWIYDNKFDHFEKAIKIKEALKNISN